MIDSRSSIPEPFSPVRAGTMESHRRAVERVIDAMRRRKDQNFSLEEMADIAFMSPYHFNRTFRQLTGIPPCQFMSALRLESAKRLLLTTELSVTDVCFEVGYNSLGTFIRRFTDLLGASPRKLRRLARMPLRVPPGVQGGEVAETRRPETGIRGRVSGPAEFEGTIFVGLFSSTIPQGQPTACAMRSATGEFELSPVADGSYHLYAIGVTSDQRDPAGFFLYESALRGGGQAIRVRNGSAQDDADVELRPARPIDPPILMTPAWARINGACQEH